MLRIFKKKNTSNLPPEGGFDTDTCRILLNEHLTYISNACESAILGSFSSGGQYLSGEGGHLYLIEQSGRLDKDELFVQVIDHLKEDEFRRLRNFRGTSSLTTYITTIVNRLLVDLIRQRVGRSRAKERSERYGDLGQKVYELLVMERVTAHEAVEILVSKYDIIVTFDQIQEIRDVMFGRSGRHQIDADLSTAWGKDGELITVNHATPESEYICQELSQKRRSVLGGVVDSLTAEDKVVVRLRFPLDDKEPLSSEEIGLMLGKSSKEVDRQIRRILVKCRELLLKKGVSFECLEPELSV
ncbi:MAG: sigma-70 family RNA polymerase sigma factor [Geobacteraceae bacterium]|nr:sigma-70 family RNA polymerase sigma factor [Geobacteraceae bacterium]